MAGVLAEAPAEGEMTILNDRWSDVLRRYRRAVKARLPFVRRSEWRRLEKRYVALLECLAAPVRPATEARLRTVKALVELPGGDVCFFAAFADGPTLKPHVENLVDHLVREGFRVLLVVNTDQPLEQVTLPSAMLERLEAAFIRENVGFDFAAWAHLWALRGDLDHCSRLLLVNDSVVGPLDSARFAEMMVRLRASKADVVGLTACGGPVPHLQSYFLCFGARALASPALRRFLAGVRVLPAKGLVIDVYEVTLTRQLEAAGLTAEALFPSPSSDPHSPDDTTVRWRMLLDAGFPFIKGSVLRSRRDAARARARVPRGLLRPGT